MPLPPAIDEQTAVLFPSTVLLDTTNVCNARCPFCPLFHGELQFDRKARPAAVMSSELYTKLIGEIASWAVQPATLIHSANGEFLQDPKVLERVATLKRNGLGPITVILTNGQFLDEKASQAIDDAEIGEVILGFDGATKKIYEEHRVRCDYERVLDNIRTFVETRRKLKGKTKVTVKFVRTRRNVHEVKAAFDLFQSIMDPELDRFQDALAVDWADNASSATDLYYVNKITKGKRRQSCYYFDTGMMINPDGVMGACCWDYNLNISDGGFGNVKEATALEVWRSTKRIELGRAHLVGQDHDLPEKCKSCIILHEPEPLLDSIQMIDRKYLENTSDTSFVYKFKAGSRP